MTYYLEGSCSDDVTDFDEISNVGIPGVNFINFLRAHFLYEIFAKAGT